MCWAVAAWRAGSSAAPHGNARPQFCLFLQHDDLVPLAGRGQRQLEAGRSTARAGETTRAGRGWRRSTSMEKRSVAHYNAKTTTVAD